MELFNFVFWIPEKHDIYSHDELLKREQEDDESYSTIIRLTELQAKEVVQMLVNETCYSEAAMVRL